MTNQYLKEWSSKKKVTYREKLNHLDFEK
uniref:Uncharacterized protein n=1 Tax=Lepeophtheirus salmonis TaxID=72036 RepID=A0A0K2UT48_LEPSM